MTETACFCGKPFSLIHFPLSLSCIIAMHEQQFTKQNIAEAYAATHVASSQDTKYFCMQIDVSGLSCGPRWHIPQIFVNGAPFAATRPCKVIEAWTSLARRDEAQQQIHDKHMCLRMEKCIGNMLFLT
jgi:hypothetical protein